MDRNIERRLSTHSIVYYGPPQSGKTSNLLYLQSQLPGSTIRQLEFGEQLEFAPVFANNWLYKFEVRSITSAADDVAVREELLDCDAIVVVVDSDPDCMLDNIRWARRLKDRDKLVWVLQCNKQDLLNANTIETMYAKLNAEHHWMTIGASAIDGRGVSQTFSSVIRGFIGERDSLADYIRGEVNEVDRASCSDLPAAQIQLLNPLSAPSGFWSWRDVNAIEFGRDLRCTALKTGKKGMYKIAEHTYLFARDQTPDGLSFCYGIAWAASDGAAERVFCGNFYADDNASPAPPDELLPAAGMTRFRDIEKHGAQAHSKSFSDLVQGTRQISFNRHTYHYRKLRPLETDLPIAITRYHRLWSGPKESVYIR